MPDSEYGPFESERQAGSSPAARAVYAAFDADPGPGKMKPHNLAVLTRACEAAGVELGAYDERILAGVANWEPATCVVIAGIIRRAREAGESAALTAAVPEWGVRFKASKMRLEPVTEQAAEGGEAEARETVADMRELYPEWNAVLITRTPERPAGPWKLAPGEGSGSA